MLLTPTPAVVPPDFLSILCCPYCRGTFAFTATPYGPPVVAACGVLRCSCSAFPVVDGIPILQKAPVGMFEHTMGTVQVEGVPVAELVRLLEAGRALDALLECLAVPAVLPEFVSRVLPWRIAHSETMERWLRGAGKRLLRAQVIERRAHLGARQVLEFYYPPHSPLGHAVGHYFVLRFCQPRHLAALSLLATLPGDPAGDKPVLDIACGLGHLEHYLTRRAHPLAAVGTDMNYFHVWIAQHWFAPGARFVCANAAEGLPFADAAFSATVCSDAWHYIPERQRLLREIERTGPGRPVFLTRVGNAEVMPMEGVEQSLAAYLDDCAIDGGADVHAFGEPDLVRAYLRGQNPFARQHAARAALVEEKWLSFAWNIGPRLLATERAASDPPHAVGTIGVNPVYQVVRRHEGRTAVQFEFPLPWFAYENHAMLSYHPRHADIGDTSRAMWQRWRDDATLVRLVESFVLIGLPDRFDAPASA